MSVPIRAGEAADYKPWGSPANWRDPARGINRTPDGFGSTDPKGANFVFADGGARFLSKDINAQVLKALSAPDGGEAIPDF
jgi:prepilin-type processing-associated H-X9-DG protein